MRKVDFIVTVEAFKTFHVTVSEENLDPGETLDGVGADIAQEFAQEDFWRAFPREGVTLLEEDTAIESCRKARAPAGKDK